MNNEKITIRDFDAAEFLVNEEMIAMYLNEVFSDGTDAQKKSALAEVARARYMSDLAEKMGISRKELFIMLTDEKELEYSNVQRFLNAVGLDLPTLQFVAHN